MSSACSRAEAATRIVSPLGVFMRHAPKATLARRSAPPGMNGAIVRRRSASATPAANAAIVKLTIQSPSTDAPWMRSGVDTWLYAHAPNVPCGESVASSHSHPVHRAGNTSTAASAGSVRAARRAASTTSANTSAGPSAIASTSGPIASRYGQSIPSWPSVYAATDAMATRGHASPPKASQRIGTGATHARRPRSDVPSATKKRSALASEQRSAVTRDPRARATCVAAHAVQRRASR